MINLEHIDDLYPAAVTALRKAEAIERKARKLRKSDPAHAAELYDEASTLYADTGIAYHRQGESELSRVVRTAIQRTRSCASNLRHPKKRRPPPTLPRPNCLACDKPLRRYKRDGQTFDDGTPREWGDYGDNRFCGLTCGWRYACRTTFVDAAFKQLKKR